MKTGCARQNNCDPGIKCQGKPAFDRSGRSRSAQADLPICGSYEVALGASLDDRMGNLFIRVGNTCARDLFGHKPDLKFVHTKDVANQQVIRSGVAAFSRGAGAQCALSR